MLNTPNQTIDRARGDGAPARTRRVLAAFSLAIVFMLMGMSARPAEAYGGSGATCGYGGLAAFRYIDVALPRRGAAYNFNPQRTESATLWVQYNAFYAATNTIYDSSPWYTTNVTDTARPITYWRSAYYSNGMTWRSVVPFGNWDVVETLYVQQNGAWYGPFRQVLGRCAIT